MNNISTFPFKGTPPGEPTVRINDRELGQIQIALSSRVELLSSLLSHTGEDMFMSTEFEDRLEAQRNMCSNVLKRIRGES